MIRIKVDFFADSFRTLTLELDERLEKESEPVRRRIISEIIADWLVSKGVSWNMNQNHSWYTRTPEGYLRNEDSFGIGLILSKRI